MVIEANGNQGTGTLVKVQNKKFILTCSHVVFQVAYRILVFFSSTAKKIIIIPG